ncbi:hypothetical protein AB0C21_11955 [Spirillospora sp. NPDC049024]
MAGRAPARHAARIVTREYEVDPWEAAELHEALAMRPWAELAEHLAHRELRHLVAHSRVLRGEDLTGVSTLDTAVFAGVPFVLQPWERVCWDFDWSIRHFSGQGAIGSPRPSFPPDGLELTVPIASTDHTGLQTEPVPDAYWLEPPITVRGTAWEGAAFAMSTWPEPPAEPYGAPTEFAAAYPDLVGMAGGGAAYGQWSEARGRVAIWRLLARIGGLAEPVDVAAIADVVARLRCVTWRRPDDDIWFMHLAIEDPLSGLTWVLDGQDFD